MRVAGIERHGGPVTMIEVAEARALRAGEVLIAVGAAGVGNWDDIVRGGGWDIGRNPPMALGVEAAGVIVAGRRWHARPPGGAGLSCSNSERGSWARVPSLDHVEHAI
jgi:NADPH:quinone reductase-like Zn-dependent oxidoreductase